MKNSIIIDDFVFRLHHQFNFALIGIGALFILAENYLDGKAIDCRKDEHIDRYCWTHAEGFLFGERSPMLIAYYIWLPFLLLICLGLSKLARMVWKEWLEGGLLRNILLRRNTEGDSLCGIKISEEFCKRKYKYAMWKFFICYVLCEVINLVSVIVMMAIIDSILHGHFFSYGRKYLEYKPSYGPDDPIMMNPADELFPTLVECNYYSSDSNGHNQRENYQCVLSNNVFNQYYFLVLWFCWICLIVISVIKLFMRFAELLVPFCQPGTKELSQMMTIPQRFVLRFLNVNLDPDVYDQVCKELVKCNVETLPSTSPAMEKEHLMS